MSRASVSPLRSTVLDQSLRLNSDAEYGVIGAGALSKSLIGQLPRKARQIGPVAGVSFRVASRMANSLRAGHAGPAVRMSWTPSLSSFFTPRPSRYG